MFDWDDNNAGHIARHNISTSEAEEVLLDRERMLVPGKRAESGESRHLAIGSTESGRVLAVVFTRRASRIRVVTAREAGESERRRYRRQRR